MKYQNSLKKIVLTCCLALIVSGFGFAESWNSYRYDNARSGYTPQTLGEELQLQWSIHPYYTPKPAWPIPSEELPRMHEDNAFHPAIADGAIFIGCNTTGKIAAIDLADVSLRWMFQTEGPVRFSPTYYKGRVLAGSDDGHVYCLNAADGSLVWKYRPGLNEEKVIGNGRMISMWPVRTNILVDDGVAYCAAGVFPYEGLYACAIDIEDGSVVWKNDTLGDYAHELQYGGICPHGYLLASEDTLFIPSGRSMPVALSRKDGKFLYYASPGAKRGGTWALLCENKLVAGVDYSGTPHKVSYDVTTGKRTGDVFASVPGFDMVVHQNHTYVVAKDGIYAIDRTIQNEKLEKVNRLDDELKTMSQDLRRLVRSRRSSDKTEQKEIDQQIDQLTKRINDIEKDKSQLKNAGLLWEYPAHGFHRIIVAGDSVFVGGEDKVIGINAKTGKEIFRKRIDGIAVGLAAGEGCLVVSSDEGPIYCYSDTQNDSPKEIQIDIKNNLYEDSSNAELYEQAAEKIVSECPTTKGYCLVLDCGEGHLAYELAKRTEFQIIGLENNPEKRKIAQHKMLESGLLGKQVIIESWDIETLPDYFANLVVSDGMVIDGKTDYPEDQRFRVLRPWGGISLLSFHQDGELSWKKTERGGLEGAGNWTQQYCDPENTACSNDIYVDNPLGILWFGEPGPVGMVERHGRAQSPVAMDGIMYMEGEELIIAADAFNGTQLWKRNIPGAVRVKTKADSGNLVITNDGLFVAAFDKCYRLDPKTGETIRMYSMPTVDDASPRRWGYISVIDNILYGSTAEPMVQEYADVLDMFLINGEWREVEDIPAEQQDRYMYYRENYPYPEDFIRATERDGTLYRSMTSFGPGGEFTQKDAVTEGLMTSDKIFAIDIETGEFLWIHDGKEIANITISLGDGKIYFADAVVTEEQRQIALQERLAMIESGVYKKRAGILEEMAERRKQLHDDSLTDARYKNALNYLIESLETEMFVEEHPEGKLTYEDADIRVVSALDAKTGKLLWSKPVELTGCCGDRMGTAFAKDMIFFYGNHGNHDAWRFRYGGLKWRRITSLNSDTGEMVWSRALNYRTRPVIVDEQIILEPQACNLYTGELITRKHPITGEDVVWEFLRPGHTCGITAASANGLFYRSACTAFYDLEEDSGVTLFGGYRPGCAISVVPACGLLLSQEAAAGCTCSYPIRCSFAMKRKPNRAKPWTVYVTPGELKPVRHLAINLGAVSDMKADDNTVWFSYPNPNTESYTHFPNYGVKFDLKESIVKGAGYFCNDYKSKDIAGTDKPWLFTSGCLGLQHCTIPLVDEGQSAKTYTVRMGFMPLDGDKDGQRVFDIKLQGKVVANDIDPKQHSSSTNVLVQEFSNVKVSDTLTLELISKSGQSGDNAALINWIEIIADDMTISKR
jgi:outer membrane protein assembly factor BamB